MSGRRESTWNGRPPNGQSGWHWLIHHEIDRPTVAYYSLTDWAFCGHPFPPTKVASDWTYLAPCLPPAALPGLDEAAMVEAWRTSSVGLLFRETSPGVVTGLDSESGVEYESVTFYRPVTKPPPASASAPTDPAEAWRPIETAPRDGTDVLTFSQGEYVIAYYDWIHRWSPSRGGDYSAYEPTHWRPLPPPPAPEPTS